MADMKMKHLEFIQSVIARMNLNSFLLKGWSVTLLAGILAVETAHPHPALIFVGSLPVILFWALDGYYLHVERMYRRRYDAVRLKADDEIDFDMTPVPGAFCLVKTLMSATVLPFHGCLAAAFFILHGCLS